MSQDQKIRISFGPTSIVHAVNMGDSLVPKSFTATFDLTEDLGVNVQMQIEVSLAGKPRCTDLTVSADDESGARIDGTLLRALNVAGLEKKAVVVARSMLQRTGAKAGPDGKTVHSFSSRQISETDYEAYLSEAARERRDRGKARRASVNLDDVAGVVKLAEAAGDPPSKAVQDSFHVSRATAWRYLKRLAERDAG